MQGSWKLALRNSFKNFRRNPLKRKRSESPETEDPKQLSKSLHLEADTDETVENDDDYIDDVEELKQECDKKRKQG